MSFSFATGSWLRFELNGLTAIGHGVVGGMPIDAALTSQDVSHAFVYIHREYDGLSRPPEIFGTIQLHLAQNSLALPQWSMLQYDR